MTPEVQELQKLVKKLQDQVAALERWKEDRTRQQLTMPIDDASMRAVAEALRNTRLEKINVKDIFFIATQESPTEEGQMRFFNDRDTQTFRVTTTKDVFTGTIDLTAV